jgi:hypothetical protein
MLRYLFGQSSIGALVVDKLYNYQIDKNRLIWLRKIGLVTEIGGFVWMFSLNLLLYGTIFSIVFAL